MQNTKPDTENNVVIAVDENECGDALRSSTRKRPEKEVFDRSTQRTPDPLQKRGNRLELSVQLSIRRVEYCFESPKSSAECTDQNA